jgi:hypothetical protein
MKRIISSVILSTSIIYLSGCLSESSATENDFNKVDFKITSQGSQSDTHGGQLIVALNEIQFNELLNRIPSISGDYPEPDWGNNEVVTILSRISACSALEVTSVTENSETTLITVSNVTSTDPALCDPTIEAFQSLEYAMVEFVRNNKPVSVIYKNRDDY